MKALRRWGPAVAWAGLIYLFSSEVFSAQGTAKWIFPFLRWLFPAAGWPTIFFLHDLLRKAGHFIEFFILSLFLLRGVRGEQRGWTLRWALASIALAAAYAALDEFHQAFVPGRVASPGDVLIDTAGAAFAQLAAALLSRRRSEHS